MSNESAITLENVSKRYRYGGTAPLSYNLRADITEWIKGSFRRGQHRHATLHEVQEKHLSESPEYFWALKDIDLEIKQGEVVGIIGRNGAGKSTLLKILSRITPPTTGTITYRGRVASLLEVGTGFHRELTGRENIFLNGSILGMKRSEIAGKLDEIIAFAEVEKFIDTPVKFYSSGMYVRLAFAVAAHLEPEILIVDEVLAVGDSQFQKKCLGKMGDIAKQGRTVLFVSHNMDAIVRLCGKGAILSVGELAAYGETRSIVENYLSKLFPTTETNSVCFDPPVTDKKLVFRRVALLGGDGSASRKLRCEIDYEVCAPTLGGLIAIRIDSAVGTPVATFTDNDLDEGRFLKHAGRYRVNCLLPTNLLKPGLYRLTISAADMKTIRYDYHESVLAFYVSQPPDILATFEREGPLLTATDWKISEIH